VSGEPPPSRARLAGFALGALAALVYLSNPGWGIFELLPDNVPGLGNVDEAGATVLLVTCVRGFLAGRKARAQARRERRRAGA
jgi:hypothetical protein